MENGVKLSVSLKDTDLFNDIAGIIKQILGDERIGQGIRDEYAGKIKELLGGDS